MIKKLFSLIGLNKWLILGVISAASVSFAAAWEFQSNRYGKQIAEIQNQQWQTEIKRQQKVVETQRLQNEIKDLVSQNRQLAKQKQKTVTEYVTKEVTNYVQSPDAGQCHFNDQWVRIYNAAASGYIPDTTAGTDAGSGQPENADTASD